MFCTYMCLCFVILTHIQEKYEALRIERSIEEGTQEAENLYYEVSGGWSTKPTIYGYRTSATIFYEKPTASTHSTGSIYTPSAHSKLQSDSNQLSSNLMSRRSWLTIRSDNLMRQ